MAPFRDDVASPVGDAVAPGFHATVAADLRTAAWRRRALLVLAVGWIGYEWGLGNETVTPWLLSWVISEHDGWSTIVVAGLVGFAFTLVQQLLSGLSVLAGFSVFERSAHAAWLRLSRRVEPDRIRWDGAGLVARAVIVFTLGATAVALLQIVSSGRVGVATHRRAVVQAAFLCAVAVGLIGAVAGVIGHVGRSIDVLSAPTDWVLRVLGNPLLWIGLIVLYFLAQRVGRPTATTNQEVDR